MHAQRSLYDRDGATPARGSRTDPEDTVRNAEIWLMDEGLEQSIPDGAAIAIRYYIPDRFAMTAGIGLPWVRRCSRPFSTRCRTASSANRNSTRSRIAVSPKPSIALRSIWRATDNVRFQVWARPTTIEHGSADGPQLD